MGMQTYFSMLDSRSESTWQWENATAGAIAGFTTVAATHPLDVVRTRFQVHDGRAFNLPRYHSTAHALLSIARLEGLKGLYRGFSPAVLGSTISWGLYFFFYGRTKQRYLKGKDPNEMLSPGIHLACAAEAGALVCLCTNPIWLIKTRLQIQSPLHQSKPYSGLYDALKTIMRDEGWRALYRGIFPGLLLVSHGAIQFTAYEELRKFMIQHKSLKNNSDHADGILNSVDYATLGGVSKVIAICMTYPFQIRPSKDGSPEYTGSWHVVKHTIRLENFGGLYKGITPSLLKNAPAASITFLVYEKAITVLKTWTNRQP